MKAKMTAAALAMTLGLAAGAANAAPTTTISPDGYGFQFADSRMAAGDFSYTSALFTEQNAGTMTGFSFNDAKLKSVSYSLIDVTDANKVLYTGSASGSFHFNEIFKAGDQFKITVSGNSNTGAFFIGTVSAVPEPGVWVMMGSGLAMLGFLATRRRSMSLSDFCAI